VAGLQNVWVCAQGLQLVRADRIVSLLLPALTGHGAASPSDQHSGKTICAEIAGGTEGDTLTRVKLADCGKSPAAELLADLASTLCFAARGAAEERGPVFVFVERDADGFSRWVEASRLPAAWPQSNESDGPPTTLTRSPLA
jgi:hypothetical protein